MQDTHGSSQEEWAGFDLDGTLAEYDGWKGIEHIGKPVEIMVLIAKLLHLLGKKIKILTARVAPRDDGDGGDKARKYVEKWCEKNLGFVPEITYNKDASMAVLFDDRAVAVEQNTGKILGGWPDFLPKASDKAKKEVMDNAKWKSRTLKIRARRDPDGIEEKKADARPSKEDLWRMYDIMQADARLGSKIKSLGFGKGGDAYRRAAIRLKVMELATLLRDGKRIRNDIAHKPGYVPSEHDADRAMRQYGDADSRLNERLGERHG